MNKICKISIVMAVLILSGIGIASATQTNSVVSVPSTASVVEAVKSISTPGGNIDFGTIKQGATNTVNYGISNNGDVEVNVAVSSSGLVQTNNGVNVAEGTTLNLSLPSNQAIAKGNTHSFPIGLTVPTDAPAALYLGTVDFTAT